MRVPALIITLVLAGPAFGQQFQQQPQFQQPQFQQPQFQQQPQMQQQGNYAGNWYCETAYTQLDQGGMRQSGNTSQFQLYLDPSQQFQAQGMEVSVAGQMQFVAQGQWQGGVDQSTGQSYFVAQGQKQDQTGFAMPWMVMGVVQADGSVMYTHETPNPQTGGAMDRLNIACRRM